MVGVRHGSIVMMMIVMLHDPGQSYTLSNKAINVMYCGDDVRECSEDDDAEYN